MQPAAGRSALRRYPALGFLAAAAALALLLPSRLSAPRSDPASLSELAPVPGAGDGSGDLADLGSASSGGVSVTGRAGGAAAAPPLAADALVQSQRPQKRCVGDPPRQTEDLLSPPCVAFHEGENGGATAPGVTRDEVAVVLHLGGDGREDQKSFVDYDDPNQHHNRPQDEDLANVIRAYGTWFNDRYMTYGRRVHLYGYNGSGSEPPRIAEQVTEILGRIRPFAIVPVGLAGSVTVGRQAASKGVLVTNYVATDRDTQSELRPLFWTYMPDVQDGSRIAASFVCRKLAARKAAFSGNAEDVDRERKFGLVWTEDARYPEIDLMQRLLRRELSDRCGIPDPPGGAGRGGPGGPGERAQYMAQLRAERVTSVLAVITSGDNLLWGGAAQGYSPEWIYLGDAFDHSVDDSTLARLYPPALYANAFGFKYDYLRAAPHEQPWYAAFRHGCPDCAAPADFRSAKVYDALNMLFWAIQTAGPRLTPANVDRGMQSIPERPSSDPSLPAAYFTVGNYSWVKDAMGTWWDPAGPEPGGKPGCYRMVQGGRRFRADEWTEGHDDIRVQSARCQGPARPA